MTATHRDELRRKLESLNTSLLLDARYTQGEADEARREIALLRDQIAAADRELLAQEVRRLKGARYSFSGADLREQLGVDAWILNTTRGGR